MIAKSALPHVSSHIDAFLIGGGILGFSVSRVVSEDVDVVTGR